MPSVTQPSLAQLHQPEDRDAEEQQHEDLALPEEEPDLRRVRVGDDEPDHECLTPAVLLREGLREQPVVCGRALLHVPEEWKTTAPEHTELAVH